MRLLVRFSFEGLLALVTGMSLICVVAYLGFIQTSFVLG